ncbi:hypothetical protein ACJIZ3_005194 [Penstemon smallii]|uniref:Uncharacterized protein n=1 Tax=Penstemon smallii TaxID=265156 RepID=A0ABD3S465_9LAMI
MREISAMVKRGLINGLSVKTQEFSKCLVDMKNAMRDEFSGLSLFVSGVMEMDEMLTFKWPVCVKRNMSKCMIFRLSLEIDKEDDDEDGYGEEIDNVMTPHFLMVWILFEVEKARQLPIKDQPYLDSFS